MTAIDPFGRTDKLDDPMLQALVMRFEARGKHAGFSKMLHDYLGAMNIESAGTVLDVGCGTGLAARAIAGRAGFRGRVAGVDLSPCLVAAATRLAGEEGVAGRLDFATGDARKLAFPDHCFDALVAHTLFSHVEDSMAVLSEAARGVKPGGTIGIFDGDYASLTFDLVDPVQGKACDEALIAAVVTRPRLMRQMPRLLRAAGLELVTSFSYVLAEAGKANFWSSAIETYRKLVPKAGVMTQEEADAWAAALRSDSDAGVFFGSCDYCAYVARRA